MFFVNSVIFLKKYRFQALLSSLIHCIYKKIILTLRERVGHKEF